MPPRDLNDAKHWRARAEELRTLASKIKESGPRQTMFDLVLPSIQVNICAGKFPPAHASGVHYLAIPVKFKSADAVN